MTAKEQLSHTLNPSSSSQMTFLGAKKAFGQKYEGSGCLDDHPNIITLTNLKDD
jgi:hypothetical protein